jgi:hypothetical protein
MTLFLLGIGCVVREFSVSFDSLRCVALVIHWQYQGLQLLCFRRWLMDQRSHNVFDNYISLRWFYFCYRFDASVVNSWTLSITNVGCHSIFIDDYKVYSDSIFADDLWIRSDIAFLTILCVIYDSIFAIHLMCRSWIHWRCRLHTSAVTQYSLTITKSTLILFSLTIYGSTVT